MPKPKRLFYAALSVLFISIGGLIFFPIGMRAVFSVLVTARPTDRADVIVVLAGSTGDRVREGVRLYHAGVAPRILMTGGPFFDTFPRTAPTASAGGLSGGAGWVRGRIPRARAWGFLKPKSPERKRWESGWRARGWCGAG